MSPHHLARAVAALLAVVAATSLALVAPASAHGAAHRDPPAGVDTQVPYLVDNAIHAEGREIPLPDDMLEPDSTYTLLGESPRGFVVERMTPIPEDVLDDYDMFLVTAGGDTHLFRFNADWGWPDYYLSTNGQRILSANRYDESTDLIVYDLSGNPVASGQANSSFSLLDFDGSRVLFSTDRTTRLWRITPNTKEQLAPAPAAFGSLQTRTLMLQRQSTHSTLSWAGFAHPSVTRWRTTADPVSLNPTGKRLATFGTGGLQIRRAIDGRIIRRFHPLGLLGPTYYGDPADQVWESTDAILALADTSNGEFIVRCDIDDGCTRASPYFTDRPSLAQVWPRS